MKKSIIVCLTACVILLTTLPVYADTVNNDTIKVGIFDYQAFYENDDGAPSGYGYEYLSTIAKYGSFRFEYIYGSWSECLSWLESGRIDMLDSAQKSPDREEKFLFSSYSTGISYGELFVRGDDLTVMYNDFPAMDGMTVGLLEGNSRNTTFLQYAKTNGFSVKTVTFNTAEQLSAALQEGKVDAIVSSNLRQGKNERPIARFSPTPFYIMINKDKPQLKLRIDTALEEILIDYPNFNANLNEKYYTVHETAPMFTKEEHAFIKESPSVRVVLCNESSPFISYDKTDNSTEGIYIDILNLIGEKTGLAFRYLHAYEYNKAVDMITSGEADIMLGYDNDKQMVSEQNLTVSDEFMSVPICFIGKSAPVYETAAFAVPENDSRIISFIKEQFPNGSIMVLESLADCYEAVLQGRADFTLDNMYNATGSIGSRKQGSLLVAFATPIKASYSLGVRKDTDPALLKILNKGIASLTDSEINSIFMHHTINKIPEARISMLLDEYRPQIFIISSLGVLVLFGILIFLYYRQRRNKQRLWHTAYIDPLTGIGNYNLFKEDIKKLLARNTHVKYVLCKFDIENLKLLNEIYGFDRVDGIIKSVANTLRDITIPGVDAYARIAGDDFIILKSYTDIKENEGFLAQKERMFLDSVGREFEFLIKFTYGIYYIENNDESVSSVLEKANYAHSVCKMNTNMVTFLYDEKVKQRAIEEKKIESRMDEALEKKQFMLYLQPKYYLSDETLAGAEALVRWTSEDGESIVYPSSFIPLFERNGFITKLDMYMLERTCEYIKSWMDEGKTPVTVSINFSRLHLLNPTFTQDICVMTDKYGIPRRYIEIELTESTMFNNEEAMLTVLEELHEVGFTLSMDDFGSGYSSLGLLKNLPVDVIKIDRHFFSNNRYKTRSKTVIENVMQMAKRLDIHTVAEGVESEEHIAFLREMGCDIVQGYYYSKPIPAHAFKLDKTPVTTPAKTKENGISLSDIGDLSAGRIELGADMPILVYRLFQMSLRKTLSETYGEGEMVNVLRNVGRLAGSAFAREILDLSLPFYDFINELTNKLLSMKIGKLNIECFDENTGHGVVSVKEDLDCSGLRERNEMMCQYDEGFIAGVFNEYTQKSYSVIEVDCWGTGANVCRFEVKPR